MLGVVYEYIRVLSELEKAIKGGDLLQARYRGRPKTAPVPRLVGLGIN